MMTDRPPAVIFLGGTGEGKSSLCCALAGDDLFSRNSDRSFAIGQGLDIGTTRISCERVKFLGSGADTLFIDTPGFNDAETTDCKNVNAVVPVIKEHPEINVIAIVWNSASPRFNKGRHDMLKQLESHFDQRFWNNVVFIVTGWSHSKDARRKRSLDPNNTEETLSREIHDFLKKHGFGIESPVPVLFIDSHYNEDKDYEKSRFYEDANKLKHSLHTNWKFQIKLNVCKIAQNLVVNTFDSLSSLIRKNPEMGYAVFVAAAAAPVVVVVVWEQGVPTEFYQLVSQSWSTCASESIAALSSTNVAFEALKNEAAETAIEGLMKAAQLVAHSGVQNLKSSDGGSLVLEKAMEAFLQFIPLGDLRLYLLQLALVFVANKWRKLNTHASQA